MITTVLNSLFLIVYLLSAMVQYNDPDALVWIAVYLAAAGMCIVQYRTRRPSWLPWALLIISLIWIATLLPSIVGQVSVEEIFESLSMKTQAVEEAREIGGLTLIAAWATVLIYQQRSR